MRGKWAHFSPVQFLPAFSVAPWDTEQPSDLQREEGQTISSQTIMPILHSLSLNSSPQNYIYQYKLDDFLNGSFCHFA